MKGETSLYPPQLRSPAVQELNLLRHAWWEWSAPSQAQLMSSGADRTLMAASHWVKKPTLQLALGQWLGRPYLWVRSLVRLNKWNHSPGCFGSTIFLGINCSSQEMSALLSLENKEGQTISSGEPRHHLVAALYKSLPRCKFWDKGADPVICGQWGPLHYLGKLGKAMHPAGKASFSTSHNPSSQSQSHVFSTF